MINFVRLIGTTRRSYTNRFTENPADKFKLNSKRNVQVTHRKARKRKQELKKRRKMAELNSRISIITLTEITM